MGFSQSQPSPTASFTRKEFATVYPQPAICTGGGYCVPACPYGVITQVPHDGRAFKCTLCYDRQKDGLEPACAKVCPTNSIQSGDVEELARRAEEGAARSEERRVGKERRFRWSRYH